LTLPGGARPLKTTIPADEVGMNFQQLRIIRETVRCNFNLTEVAAALYTSQSGVSKHIKDLEDELGIELFVRRGKRLLGLTEPGAEMAAIVERVLLETANMKRLAEQFVRSDHGELTVATTHTQARYALPTVVAAFKQAYPDVRLVLHQGNPNEIAAMLLDGDADIAVATEGLIDSPQILAYPYYSWHHGVVVPQDHPLTAVKPLTSPPSPNGRSSPTIRALRDAAILTSVSPRPA
jgi:LysR family cys regulon transcriptional activator